MSQPQNEASRVFFLLRENEVYIPLAKDPYRCGINRKDKGLKQYCDPLDQSCKLFKHCLFTQVLISSNILNIF